MTPPDLEQRIRDTYAECLEAQARAQPNLAARKWEEVVRLIGERTSERVAEMERDMGLR